MFKKVPLEVFETDLLNLGSTNVVAGGRVLDIAAQ